MIERKLLIITNILFKKNFLSAFSELLYINLFLYYIRMCNSSGEDSATTFRLTTLSIMTPSIMDRNVILSGILIHFYIF